MKSEAVRLLTGPLAKNNWTKFGALLNKWNIYILHEENNE